ncbi:MAG TPA: preprotein translocase subunit SecY [Bacillota bacterium]|nr:preprotein translocase subunit SecY [Clostridiales bacterium]HPT85830.1 preprotein translocase subunit SecY [Bacillota bacterium]
MFKTFIDAWKIPDLRKRMLFVIFILILYRFGAVIPVPFISSDMLNYMLSFSEGSMFQYLNILSGQAFSRATLFALSITPYINASIIMQLLTVAIPALENLQKSGEEGRKKITQITRYVTVALGLITSYGYYMYMRNMGVLTNYGVFAAIVIIACYSAGTALIMWMAEKINENGIGNGISMILFANIVSGMFSVIGGFIDLARRGVWGIILSIIAAIGSVLIVTFVVFITNSERRLPVQYAKRVVGRRMYGGQSSNLPLKLNMSGVMPIIFANSIVALPSTIAILFPAPKEGTFWYGFLEFFSYRSWFYALLFFVLIILFSFFYTSISFNPVEIANNLKSNGGFIPGIRPGKPTADYITKILNRITLIGAIFLAVIAVLPLIVNLASNFALGAIAFSGSSLLIVVGVVLETAREIEAQMTLRHYKGFLE